METICKTCGKKIKIKPSAIIRGRGNFCSRKCHGMWIAKNLAGKNSHFWKGGKIEITCLVCGKAKEIPRALTKNNGGRFCSRKCSGIWKSEHLISDKSPRWRGGKIKRTCEICGNEFMVNQHKIKILQAKFCSKNCFHVWQKEHLKGENSYFWKGGLVKRTCLLCSKDFSVKPSDTKKGRGKFCSHSCNGAWQMKHSKNKNTFIELKVEEMLKKLGIEFESQKLIPEGRTVSDFYIPEQRLVIYADGTYWHKSEMAKKKGVINKDQCQDFLLGMNGYKVLRLPEKEITENPRKCIRRIKQASVQ